MKEPEEREPFVQIEQRQNTIPIIEESAVENALDPVPEPDEDWGFGSSKKSKTTVHRVLVYRDQPMGQLLWNHFKDCFGAYLFRASSYTVEIDNISAVLLYHAKLCVLADRNLISGLREKCLANLCGTLMNLNLDMPKVGSMLDLVEFVYTEDGVQGVPKLREMIFRYVAAKIGILRQDERMKLVMEKNAQLGADLVYAMSDIGNWT